MPEIVLEISFGATKGLPNYSSERADERIRITIESDGKTIPDWLNDIHNAEDLLRNQAVYTVADTLGLEAAMSEGGRASLIWPASQPMPAPPGLQVTPTAPPPSAPQGGGGGVKAPPKATREEYAALDRYAMNFGGGMKMYVDQRPLKAAGKYSPKAPDFKEDVANGDGFWVVNQDGTLNLETQQAMAASGIQ